MHMEIESRQEMVQRKAAVNVCAGLLIMLQAEELNQKDAQWLVNGKWGMVQFCDRK
jgi:hypothetical protein